MTNQLSLTLIADEVEQLQDSFQTIQVILARTRPINGSITDTAAITGNLQESLHETLTGCHDAHQRQFAFARFKQIVNEQLWVAYSSQPHRLPRHDYSSRAFAGDF